MVGVVPVGPGGGELTSTFQRRESASYKTELGNALVNFARVVPGGLLVFFPSSAALRSAHEAWAAPALNGAGLAESPSVLERLGKMKQIIVEPRDSVELQAAVKGYREAIERYERTNHGGAILLAVCRGRLSEGVDFSDAACRAVVVTGLPLPPIFDPKVVLKKRFLDAGGRRAGGTLARARAKVKLSGEDWYQQQAMRAINQVGPYPRPSPPPPQPTHTPCPLHSTPNPTHTH